MSLDKVETADSSHRLTHYAGRVFSNPLTDGAIKRDSCAGRRRIASPVPHGEADVARCIAAWHGVLHWLSYNDEPVVSLLVDRAGNRFWPLITEVAQEVSLGRLQELVMQQWPESAGVWLDTDAVSAPWLDTLRHCHVIRLADDGVDDAGRASFELVRTAEGWVTDCASAEYSELYQQQLGALWEQLLRAQERDPAAKLAAQNCARDDFRIEEPAGDRVALSGNLVRRFLQQVERSADRLAVTDELGSLTYRELDERSTAWAFAIEQQVTGSGHSVGVSFERNRYMVVAQLAVLKAGCVFIPIDAGQPEERLRDIAEDAELSLILSERSCVVPLGRKLPQTRTLIAEDIADAPTAYASSAPEGVGIDDPAYVIFTSGSTGRPKGVRITHGNLLNFVTYLDRHLVHGEKISQFAPFTFDASVAEIHAAILNGGRLYVLPRALIDNPDRLQDYMTRHGISFAAFPPQYARHLSPARLPGLRTLLTAGSAPDPELVRRWQPHVNYINAYGPTETTILSTAWRAQSPPDDGAPIVIGTPISNTDVRVVNRFGHSVPCGVVGELLIGGAGVSSGYLKRDDLNRTVFSNLDGVRWYRSGDLCCFNANHELVFAGRVDRQIKLRGHRLEPGEVEAAFNSIDGVELSAAVAVEVSEATQLIVFCQGTGVAEENLREAARFRLPEWAQPNRIFWLATLPLTGNGKIEYSALQTLALQQIEAEQKEEDYVDATEEEVAAVWKQVLGLVSVSRDDNFIHLGGDSLTSLVVMSALKRLGYDVNSTQLLTSPKLADFAQLLRGQDRTRSLAHLHDYDSRVGTAPLSPIQGWFFQLELSEPGTLCQTLVFDAREALDPDRLRQALGRLTQYHDQLRAQFRREPQATAGSPATQWRQCVVEPELMPAPVAVTQLTEASLAEATERTRLELARSLDIERAPLFRIAILQTPQTSRVVWVIHHLLVDTISHGVLLDDLYQLYSNTDHAVREVLPGKPTGYLEWSERLADHARRNAVDLLGHWRAALDASQLAEPLPLRAPAATPSLTVEHCELDTASTRALLERAGACYRQTTEELVLAAVYLALAKTFGVRTLGVDIEWHGRDEAFAGPQGVDRSVGWFTSVHPLFMTLPADPDLGAWLIALKEARACVADRGRDFYALRYLSTDAATRAAFDRYRAPEVLFNFSGVVQRRNAGWQTVPVTAIEMGAGNANPYSLSVESEIRDGRLRVGLYLDDKRWSARQSARLRAEIDAALAAVIAHCCDPENRRHTPSDFPLQRLSLAQLEQLPPGVRDIYPLTDMQQTMFRHAQTYQVCMHYAIPRRFDEKAFEQAVAAWVARHDCLRTYVQTWDDESVVQVVLDSFDAELEIHRLQGQEATSYADAWIGRERRRPVSVTQQPPFKLIALDGAGEHFSVILSIHHIIHDGWSIELLLSDLFETYRHFLREGVDLPAAPSASVKDIVAEQRRVAADARWRDYWEQQRWGDEYARLPLSAAAVDAGAEPRVELYAGHLDPVLQNDVREAAKVLGVTGNSIWLAAYLLLMRYLGGQEQVRCGVIQSGRPASVTGVESITGCCVNTLPMVLNISAAVPLRDLVKRVNRGLLEMQECAAYPLSQIHTAARRHTGGRLFDTLFNIESGNYGRAATGDRPRLLGGYESTNYELIFGLIEGAADAEPGLGVGLRIGYDSARYCRDDIVRWTEVYARVVALITESGECAWEQLQPLPQSMWQQLEDWNDTARDYPNHLCLQQIFEAQVEKTPEATAVVYADEALSYAQLNASANRLAHHLRGLGVGPDVPVGLCLERSLELVVGIYAILKAGGAYVPLDPDYPASRLSSMLADIQPPVVLTQQCLRDRLPETTAAIIALDTGWDEIARAPDHNPGLPAVAPGFTSRADALAYVIFTSGSTGRPKGVAIPHSAIVNRLFWMQDEYRLDESDCVLQKTPYSFDVSVWEFFWPLLNGARLVLARPGGHKDRAYLADIIARERVTTLHFVPPMLAVFLEEPTIDRCASLRRVIVSGEALSPDLMKRHYARLDVPLHNLYGPTEAAVDVTYWACDPHSGYAAVPIGRPVANTRMYVLDASLKPVPVGVTGELFIGGVQLARGYLKRPELTAEKFIPDPFSNAVGARLYRTGDLARFMPDGNIEFLGRIDHQVKIRGFRIELGDIEAALAEHPEVREVVVVAREDKPGDKRLVTYLVADPQRVTAQALREHLRGRLPEYMTPSAFVMLDALPLTPNGKVDRKQLPAPELRLDAADDYAQPRTAAETLLAGIWCEVLGVDRIGIDTNFFEAGGDSILTLQVITRAAAHELKITTQQLFETPTIRALAAGVAGPVAEPVRVDATPPAGSDGPSGPPPARFPLAGLSTSEAESLAQRHAGVDDVYPATAMQQGLLLFAERDSAQGSYLNQFRVRLAGVDPAALRRSWEVLLVRHDVLRTAFVDLGKDTLLQVVASGIELPWRELDWRERSMLPDLETRLQEVYEQERLTPFELQRAPLMRVLLVRTDTDSYRMVWTYHHAIIDGWSMSVILGQLLETYRIIMAGAMPAEVKTASYRKYIEWLHGRDRAAAEGYWRAQLAGFEGATRLSLPAPADGQRPQEQRSHVLELDAATTARLTGVARAAGVTLSTVMQAAWALLLSKYSGERDVVLGYTVSGRPADLPGVEAMVGLFINSLPMRVSIAPDMQLGEWLQQVQQCYARNEAFSFVPLLDIQRWSGHRHGLFDTLVVVENFPLDASALVAAADGSGLQVEDPDGSGRNELALNLVVYPGEVLRLELAYQAQRFGDADSRALLGHLGQLLRGIAQGTGQRLAQLDMLTAEETRRALQDWNDTGMDYPAARTLVDLFEARTEEFAELTALVQDAEDWSYARLRQRVDAIAQWLHAAGVRRGDFVALSLEKTPDLIAAIFGILRAGAAYVPVAVDCPPERRDFILEDAGIRWVLTDSVHTDCAAVAAVTPLYIDTLTSAEAVCLPAVDAQSPAYVIYTSGTTGRPKGVVVSHRNLVNFCSWFIAQGWTRPGDAVNQFAPYTFDASVSEIFCALFSGAELHLLNDAVIKDPALLTRYMVDHRIRFGGFPPPYLQLLDPGQLPGDLTVLSAGSAPTLELARRWGTHCRYINAYGPTETTILSTAWRYAADDLAHGRLPIGRPIANTVVYVLDREGQLCPPGVVGEICIGGDGVTPGYLNRPELTEAHYRDDPWRPGGRLYQTGDLGRWLPDGSIEFAGRRDQQVKVRGFRIELSGVETELCRHPDVQTAFVQAIGDGNEKMLAAWLVPTANALQAWPDLLDRPGGFISAVRAGLGSALPDYMIPGVFTLVRQLPLTANGKVDLDRLAAPDLTQQGTQYVAPEGELETALVDIYAQLLKIDAKQIGTAANFFEIGGHSLLATRLVNEIVRRLGVRLPVHSIFEHNTIAALAREIDAAGCTELAAIEPVPRSGPLPLSMAQQRLWFLEQFDGGSAQYNQPFALRLRGKIKVEAIQRALTAIVARHEVLRTVYTSRDRQPLQRILEPVAVPLERIDVSHLDETARREEIERLLVAEALRPFDLTSDLMLRAALLKSADADHHLLITVHHIASDGWSVGILMRELAHAYQAGVEGRSVDLAPLPIQYADFASWQRQHLRGEVLGRQLRYWRERLHGIPLVHSLPLDKPRPRSLSCHGRALTQAIDGELTGKLNALARAHGATLFMVLHAAFSLLLARYSGQTDIVIGTTVANRDHEDIERLIGFFVNTLVLRSDLSGRKTFAELLAECRKHALDAYAQRQLPFDQLVDDLQPERSLSYNPVFQIMLSMDNVEPVADLRLGDVEVAPVQGDNLRTSQFDLTLDIGETGDHLSFRWTYATDIFVSETIGRMAVHFNRVLEAVVAAPDRLIGEVDFLLPEERHQLVVGFNETVDARLLTRTWPELFAERVRTSPGRVAVLCGDERLTYRELDRRSTRLACALQARGIERESVVALHGERGIDYLVMIVAVLQAGAAYLPLDPALPNERCLTILNESEPDLVLTVDPDTAGAGWIATRWNAAKTVSLPALATAAESEPGAPGFPDLSDLAYVIYTSGSTGTPKGVMIEHRGMINNMLAKVDPLALSERDVIAQTASQSFDISVWQFLTALVLGARVSIVPDAITRDPEALLQQLRDHEVSVWEPVPSVIQAALAAARDLPHLRWVLPTGEALTPGLVARWFAHYPDVPLMNAYGPAECSDDVSFQPLHAPDEKVLIGTPVANAHLHVVDEYLNLVPVGVIGELAVSGPVVGRGYRNAPELTQTVFRDNPYTRYDGDNRLYLSGDLVRRQRDGSLEYIGRKDFQVKIRGFRIELGEVETRIEACDGVTAAVAVARDDCNGVKQLIAYVVLDPDLTGVETLRSRLRAQLPDYMVPSVFVPMDTLPLNPNGKVDRRRLPEPDMDALREVDYVAPCGPLEAKMAHIWQEVLDVSRVGRQDNFFHLGGNSLTLVTLVSRLRDADVAITVDDLYQAQTLQACAALATTLETDLSGHLLEQGIAHRLCTRAQDGSPLSVLFIDDGQRADRASLKASFAAQDPQRLPDYIRFATDIETAARRFDADGPDAIGVAVGSGPSPDLAALQRDLHDYVTDMTSRMTSRTLQLTPIQRQMATWSQRETMDRITVHGWYEASELQLAFAALVKEQTLLHAVLDAPAGHWRLCDPRSQVAAIPLLDLRTARGASNHASVAAIAERMRDVLADSALPYTAVWISETDTRHHLLLVNDHLISDGASSAVWQTRLTAHLRGAAPPLAHEYRDYVQRLCGAVDPAQIEAAQRILGLDEVGRYLQDTVSVLHARRDKALQVVSFEQPLRAQTAPVEQAFDLFTGCVSRLTGLGVFSMLFNHHGRRLGEAQYFDHVGLFLDKVPFAVRADTPYRQVTTRLQELERAAINYTALAAGTASGSIPNCLDLAGEVVFNFITNDGTPRGPAPTDRLRDFFGVLFEAQTDGESLFIQFIYRGDPNEMNYIERVPAFVADPPHRTGISEVPAGPVAAANRVMPFALEIDNVRKSYGAFEAVRGISFNVPKGCCFGILGPNGAGKTSLLSMIEGITPISAGKIRVLGMDVGTRLCDIQPHVGVQLQQNNYFQFLTVSQLLRFYKEFRSANRRKADGLEIDGLLERLNLQSKKNLKVDELSGGQKQRLSLAIALLEDPDVLFLDEPTSALDPHTRHYTWDFIEQLKTDTDKTIILTTHYMEEAERLCDELLIMNEGRIISQGTPAELVGSLNAYHEIVIQYTESRLETGWLDQLADVIDYAWDSEQCRLTVKTEKITGTILALLNYSEQQGMVVNSFDINRPNLEDVFLTRTGAGKEMVK